MTTQLTYEQWLASLCIWREARNLYTNYPSALSGVWWVINNRLNDTKHRWPRTISGIILQPFQFSSFNANNVEANKFPTQPNPDLAASSDWSAFLHCMLVVSEPLGQDITKGANMYESEPPDKRPSWAIPELLTITIGSIRFYKI